MEFLTSTMVSSLLSADEFSFDALHELLNIASADIELCEHIIESAASHLGVQAHNPELPDISEAVGNLLSQLVRHCPHHASNITSTLIFWLCRIEGMSEYPLTTSTLDTLVEVHPERAEEVLDALLSQQASAYRSRRAADVLLSRYVVACPQAATRLFIRKLNTNEQNLNPMDRHTLNAAKKAALSFMGTLLRLNLEQAGPIIGALFQAYINGNEKQRRNAILQCRTALEMCPELGFNVGVLTIVATEDTAPCVREAAAHQLPDTVRAQPRLRERCYLELSEMLRERNEQVNTSALRELPRAAKFYPPRAHQLCGEFLKRYKRAKPKKRKRVADGIPDMFAAGAQAFEAEKLADLLLRDCNHESVPLRVEATRQLTPSLEAYPKRASDFVTALLKGCKDASVKVRRVSGGQLANAATTWIPGARSCTEATFNMCTDPDALCRAAAKDQLEGVLKACPDLATRILERMIEVDREGV